tara:strand:+ start:2356 stop:2742 length:387 start_codon:yes stop_codon:yes gene_type:complete
MSDDDSTMGSLTPEFRGAMKEWIDLKQVLTNARKDIKALNDREKNLKTFIKGFMKSNKIDTCNLKRGKVSLSTKSTKKGMSKDTIERGLTSFFDGDEHRVTSALEAIHENREVTERQVLSLTGLKRKD